MNTDELIEKFSKYEADYTQRLMAKYFSDKDIFGGNVFEQSTKIDGETIKASRWHCAQSYADPVQYFKEKSVPPLISSADAQANVSNGKSSVDKEG